MLKVTYCNIHTTLKSILRKLVSLENFVRGPVVGPHRSRQNQS